MRLKRYSKREPFIFIWIMIPYIGGMNVILFGTCVLTSMSQLLLSFVYSGIYLTLGYLVFGVVAFLIKKQFPAAGDLFRRVRIMLPVFYVMNVAAIEGLTVLYQQFDLVLCTVNDSMVWWGVLYGCIISTAITFINEGIANWEAWKSSLSETDRLKNIYQRSKLIGLKGQINPHFLFNCFNTLSGLIQEDEEKAEAFLDEMTKVHRYLLSSDDELLVPVNDELKFAESYLYLTKERFGKAVEARIHASQKSEGFLLPRLSMQVILENIIYANAISKSDPLCIIIYCTGDEEITITNSIHEKIIVKHPDDGEGLDNLIYKYKHMNAGTVEIVEEGNKRMIRLPFIKDQKEVL